jgi:hypothetical protein
MLRSVLHVLPVIHAALVLILPRNSKDPFLDLTLIVLTAIIWLFKTFTLNGKVDNLILFIIPSFLLL